MIESYEFGRIVIDGKEYTRDVIVLPGRVKDDWWRKQGHELHVEDIEDVLEEGPEILIVGTGYHGLMEVLPETREFLDERGVELVVDRTTGACRAYNDLAGRRKVIAALHLTC